MFPDVLYRFKAHNQVKYASFGNGNMGYRAFEVLKIGPTVFFRCVLDCRLVEIDSLSESGIPRQDLRAVAFA